MASATPWMATSVALPRAASLSVALPAVLGGGGGVDQVVGDLEGAAEGRAEIEQAVAILLGAHGRGTRPPARQSGTALRSSSPARGRSASSVSVRPSRLDVEHLAAGHAADAGGRGQRADQRGADQRVAVDRRVGEDVEGDGQQRVAGKDRRRLAELLVDASAGRGGDRRRPWPAGRRGRGCRRGRIPAPRRRGPPPRRGGGRAAPSR